MRKSIKSGVYRGIDIRLDIARQKKIREDTEEENAQELGDRILQL
jgi:hypothetical protein